MKLKARIAVGAAALLALVTVGDVISPWLGAQPVGFVGPAEAVIGRPLTPVSFAGVGRRTVRRCAVGIYRC